uniref:aspartyl aminopeptidase n=1 Tax=Panagrolaimus davidi TaxID=227884 RepID=A0A914P9W9_9BILA
MNIFIIDSKDSTVEGENCDDLVDRVYRYWTKELILCILNLAIHLEPDREKTTCNKEVEIRPVLSAAITDLFKEFISGQRLDNLVGAYICAEGLVESLADNSSTNDSNIRIAAAYDNEEVGSASAQGADSNFNE